MNHFVQIHAKAEGYDGSLQEEFRQAFAFNLEGVRESEAVDQPAEKRKWRRKQGCRQNQPREEDDLAHS